MPNRRQQLRTAQGATVGWVGLAHAIIMFAVDELATCYAGIRPKYEQRGVAESIEHFLRSEWCYSLGGVDGDALVRAARERSDKILFREKHKCAKCHSYMNKCPHHYLGQTAYIEAQRWQELERKRGRLACYKEKNGMDTGSKAKGYITVGEAAKEVGATYNVVHGWITRYNPTWAVRSGRYIKVDIDALRKWLDERDGQERKE